MSDTNGKTQAVVVHHVSGHGSLFSYIIGFVLSIALTLVAYSLTVSHTLSRDMLIFAITGLAMVQLLVQLLFFLHLSQESRPRWRLIVFGLMIIVVAILVYGSVWIMNNLNYKMMPKDLKVYMQKNEGL
jgi:cytochrome o ubiquinol oxidase operon protein cyoD